MNQSLKEIGPGLYAILRSKDDEKELERVRARILSRRVLCCAEPQPDDGERENGK